MTDPDDLTAAVEAVTGPLAALDAAEAAAVAARLTAAVDALDEPTPLDRRVAASIREAADRITRGTS